MSITYRGYTINQNSDRWYEISLNGKLIAVRKSEEQAYSFIDAQKRGDTNWKDKR